MSKIKIETEDELIRLISGFLFYIQKEYSTGDNIILSDYIDLLEDRLGEKNFHDFINNPINFFSVYKKSLEFENKYIPKRIISHIYTFEEIKDNDTYYVNITPLAFCCIHNKTIDIIKVLIENAGAKVNLGVSLPEKYEESSPCYSWRRINYLPSTAWRGYDYLPICILKQKYPIYLRSPCLDLTPFYLASLYSGSLRVLKYLIKMGAYPIKNIPSNFKYNSDKLNKTERRKLLKKLILDSDKSGVSLFLTNLLNSRDY